MRAYSNASPRQRPGIAVPVRWYGEDAPLAEWLSAAHKSLAHVPAVELTWLGYRAGDRITAASGTKGLRLEVVCASHDTAEAILAKLDIPIEHLLLRATDNTERLEYADPKAVAKWLATFAPTTVVEMDEAWTNLLARAKSN